MANIAKIITKDAVCRLCFGISNDLKDIFDDPNNYAERILNFLHLKVVRDDDLSTKICWSCGNYLDMFKQFFTKIIDTQKHHLAIKFEQYQMKPVFLPVLRCESLEANVIEIPEPKFELEQVVDVETCTKEVIPKFKIYNRRRVSPRVANKEGTEAVPKIVSVPVQVAIENSESIQEISHRKTRSNTKKGSKTKITKSETDITIEKNPEKYSRPKRRKCVQKQKVSDNDDSDESEPEIFQNYQNSEDEFKPPLTSNMKIKNPSKKKKVDVPNQTSPGIMDEEILESNSKKGDDYSLLAVYDPNNSSWTGPFNEEWPSSEAFEKFPKKILENGNITIKGKKLTELVSKFYKLVCEICTEPTNFSDIRQLFLHYTAKHKERGYVSCCGTNVQPYRMAVLHMVRHLQPEAFKCNICDYIVSRPKFLELHLKTHLPREEKPFACPHCPKTFCWKNAYRVHLETHQPEGQRKIYICPICSKTYDTPGGLSTHKKLVHSSFKSEKHVCHICAREFSTRPGLLEHINTIHEPREKNAVQCVECGSWLMNKRCLKTHMMLHSNLEYKCEQCEYRTKKHFLLKKHVITQHSTEKPWECSQCDKKFKLKRALTIHLQQAHSESKKKMFKCNFCDKQFGSSTNFYTHRKNIHPKELQAMRENEEEEKRLKRIQAGLEEETSELPKEKYTVIYKEEEDSDGTNPRIISIDAIGSDSNSVEIAGEGQMIVISIEPSDELKLHS